MRILQKTSTQITLFTLAFFALVILYPGHGYSDFLFMFSAAAALLFGIFIVFSISNSHERINKVNEFLKVEDANNLSIYRLSRVFGKETNDEIRALLDTYLMDQIDYQLEDFHKSGGSFHDLYKYITDLEPLNRKQEAAYGEMLHTLTDSSSNRIQVETLVNQKLSRYEWISVWSLAFVTISHTYEMSHKDEIFNAILLTILASASLLLVLVLRDLDNLKWQKGKWTWQPLHRLFLNMDLMPYYPRIIIESGEAKVPHDEKIRLADYPNPYPDISGKTVDVVGGDDVRKSKP